MLIEEILTALPDIKIMILEPFCLDGPAMEETDKHKSIYTEFRADIEEKAVAAKRIAENFGLSFVPLQEKFDSVYNPNNPTYWSFDGVHPTPAGHALITHEGLDMFNEIRVKI